MALVVYYSEQLYCRGSNTIRNMIRSGTIRECTLVCIEDLLSEMQNAHTPIPEWLNGVPLCVEILENGDKLLYRASDAIHFLKMPLVTTASAKSARTSSSRRHSDVSTYAMDDPNMESPMRMNSRSTTDVPPTKRDDIDITNMAAHMHSDSSFIGEQLNGHPSLEREECAAKDTPIFPEQWNVDTDGNTSDTHNVWSYEPPDDTSDDGGDPPKVTEKDVQAEMARRSAEIGNRTNN